MDKAPKKVNVREIAIKVLQEVYAKQAYANIAMNRVVAKEQISALDRKFLTELVYGTVKATNTLDWIISSFVNRPLSKIPPMILYIMRVACYQIMYMDKVPPSAACNEAVELSKKYTHQGTVKFVNGVLRSIIRGKDSIEFPDLATKPIQHIALKHHHPEWLVKLWLEEFGQAETIELCTANNLAPHLTIRVNTIKINKEQLIERLAAEEITVEQSRYAQDGLIITDMKRSLADSQTFKQGLWQIQDESSMLVAQVLDAQPGSTVLDMCAAPGGKSTHIAQYLQNSGKVLSCDIYEHKLNLIKENSSRLGIKILQTFLQDATIYVEQFNNIADYVLVDAPCSGLGVLRRRADARWRKQERELLELPELQLSILKNAARYLKPGGRLVYSTCTIRRQENQDIIERFVQDMPEFEYEQITHPLNKQPVREIVLYPHIDGVDGFYIVSLRKKV